MNYTDLLKRYSEETQTLLDRRALSGENFIKRALGIDWFLRELVDNAKLLEFLTARDAKAELVYRAWGFGQDATVLLDSDGSILLGSSDWRDTNPAYRLEPNAREARANRAQLLRYSDFVESGSAFVAIRGGNGIRQGDLLADMYHREHFKDYDAPRIKGTLEASLLYLVRECLPT